MHVPMEQLKVATGTFMLHVPYTGAGPAVLALLGGQIDALSTGPSSVMQHVRAGKLRVLAHWGEGRLAALPEVPSFKELGVPISYSQWSGLFVPAGTPEAVVTKLRQAAKAASRRCPRQTGAGRRRHVLPVPGRARVRALRAGRCHAAWPRWCSASAASNNAVQPARSAGARLAALTDCP